MCLCCWATNSRECVQWSAAVSSGIWNRHSDFPSPVPCHQQPREPFNCRGIELGWGSALFLFDFQNWSVWSSRLCCSVPQLIASAELTFTEPLVIQTVSHSCSSEAWNWKWQFVFQLSPSKVAERTLCKTLFMQEFFLNFWRFLILAMLRLRKGLLHFADTAFAVDKFRPVWPSVSNLWW